MVIRKDGELPSGPQGASGDPGGEESFIARAPLQGQDEPAPAASTSEDREASPEPIIRLSREELRQSIEAVLFSTGEPIGVRALSDLFQASVHDVREAIEELRLEYTSSGRAFRLEDIAGGAQILTLPRYEPWIRRYLSRARETRLSPAAFETLSVIAYKQPINKADLEAIRGVQCGPILKTLMDRNLIKVVGREETLGRPLLYGSTKRFLESFGLSSITALPQPELDARAASPEAASRLYPEGAPAPPGESPAPPGELMAPSDN